MPNHVIRTSLGIPGRVPAADERSEAEAEVLAATIVETAAAEAPASAVRRLIPFM